MDLLAVDSRSSHDHGEQRELHGEFLRQSLGPITRVLIESLLPADSPRSQGEDGAHARMLANMDAPLPPILVHRGTMRVIDGMHRLRAAILRGDECIAVRFFEGSADLAFVIAVESNVTHGLPLSLADRESAAARIICSHPHWSDRVIASATGLASKTVGAIRQRSNMDVPHVDARIGRDGRIRPLNCAEGRRLASQIITNNPDASLREIAKSAGISPATARDVRDRLARGDDPLPLRQRVVAEAPDAEPETDTETEAEPATIPRTVPRTSRRAPLPDRSAILQNLRRDPALRFTESGRALLRWLDNQAGGPDGWERLLADIPTHCTYVVADIARSVAEDWLEFAEQLKLRAVSSA